MALVIVNPTKRTSTGRPKAKKKGSTMAKKARSAKQRAATARMLAARKRTTRNPARPKRYTAKRRATRNPAPRRRMTARRKVHRNPGLFDKGGLFTEMMTVDGLLMVGAVVTMPTIQELAVQQFAPSLTGYSRIGVKGLVGLALSMAAYSFLNKKVGLIMGAISVGTAAAEGIQTYRAGSAAPAAVAMSGYPGLRNIQARQIPPSAIGMSRGQRAMAGYPGLTGYGVGSEPGVRY